MRHSSLDLTMNVYLAPTLLDVAGAIEALLELTAGEGVEAAGYVRNAGCSEVQLAARECNEESVEAGGSVGEEGNVTGLPAQDLASPCKAMQEVSNSLPTKD